MKPLASGGGIALLLLAFASPAPAVNWNWLDKTPVQTFTEQDWILFRENMRSALDTLPDGASSEWKNSQSGNSGRVTILSSKEEGDNYCRSVEIDNSTPTQSGKNHSQLCRQADGSWKIIH